jgi:hypothetical protein
VRDETVWGQVLGDVLITTDGLHDSGNASGMGAGKREGMDLIRLAGADPLG